MTVMLLGGLWHGAAYTYIVWGGIHGVCLAIERTLHLHRNDGPYRAPWLRTAWAVVVQVAVLVAWVFFRSDTVGNAARFLGNLFGPWRVPPPWMLTSLLFLLPLVAMHAHTWLEEQRLVRPLGAAAKAGLAAAMTYGILSLYGSTSAFIYFQF